MGRSLIQSDILTPDNETREIYYCNKHPIHRALVRAGYFPASPESPKKAFSVRVLELYRYLLAFGVSHQAWCGALWSMHTRAQGTVSTLIDS
jgi:hypothetical protein